MATKDKDTSKDEKLEVFDANTGETRSTTLAEFQKEQAEINAPAEVEDPAPVDYSQDEADVKAMGEYYVKQHGNAWFVRCLECKRVIAVEVPMANGNTGRGRQIYSFQDLFVTCRTRLDKTPDKQPMLGYQCMCGNDTRLATVEQGEVPTTHAVLKDGKVVVPAATPRTLSPFEREQLRATVAIKQAQSKQKADYEVNGNVERFETFQLERVA